VVDEAFMDAGEGGASLAPKVGDHNIVVLRSFGKFFGLAGLRLGFALAGPAVAAQLRARLGPWAVAGPAIAIGASALADRAWVAMTRARLAQAARRLDQVLAGAGLAVAGGTPLFRRRRRRPRCSSIWGVPASWRAASVRSPGGCGSGCRRASPTGSVSPPPWRRLTERRRGRPARADGANRAAPGGLVNGSMRIWRRSTECVRNAASKDGRAVKLAQRDQVGL
jgi:hypothetical protein